MKRGPAQGDLDSKSLNFKLGCSAAMDQVGKGREQERRDKSDRKLFIKARGIKL